MSHLAIDRRSALLGVLGAVGSAATGRATNIDENDQGGNDDIILLRLEHILARLRAISARNKNLVIGLLVQAAIAVIEEVLEYWRQQTVTPDPTSPVDMTEEVKRIREAMEKEFREKNSGEREQLRRLISDLQNALDELKRKPQPDRTCGRGRSRQADGTCRDHMKD